MSKAHVTCQHGTCPGASSSCSGLPCSMRRSAWRICEYSCMVQSAWLLIIIRHLQRLCQEGPQFCYLSFDDTLGE